MAGQQEGRSSSIGWHERRKPCTISAMKSARPTASDTNLYSAGAEFLVLGQLSIRGMHATKAYTRYPGWDVLASDPQSGRTCRLQVKARLATDFDGGFPIKNFNAEFVVLVALNRGYRYGKASRIEGGDSGEREPEFYVLPMALVSRIAENAPRWGTSAKIYMRRDVEDWQQYNGAWHLVSSALSAAD